MSTSLQRPCSHRQDNSSDRHELQGHACSSVVKACPRHGIYDVSPTSTLTSDLGIKDLTSTYRLHVCRSVLQTCYMSSSILRRRRRLYGDCQ